jgi:hypothetical protein
MRQARNSPHGKAGQGAGQNSREALAHKTIEFCNTIPPKADIRDARGNVHLGPILLKKAAGCDAETSVIQSV